MVGGNITRSVASWKPGISMRKLWLVSNARRGGDDNRVTTLFGQMVITGDSSKSQEPFINMVWMESQLEWGEEGQKTIIDNSSKVLLLRGTEKGGGSQRKMWILVLFYFFKIFDVDLFGSPSWICYNIPSVFYVLVLWLLGMWDLSPQQKGFEPASPAIEDEVSTTGLPGKSLFYF